MRRLAALVVLTLLATSLVHGLPAHAMQDAAEADDVHRSWVSSGPLAWEGPMRGACRPIGVTLEGEFGTTSLSGSADLLERDTVLQGFEALADQPLPHTRYDHPVEQSVRGAGSGSGPWTFVANEESRILIYPMQDARGHTGGQRLSASFDATEGILSGPVAQHLGLHYWDTVQADRSGPAAPLLTSINGSFEGPYRLVEVDAPMQLVGSAWLRIIDTIVRSPGGATLAALPYLEETSRTGATTLVAHKTLIQRERWAFIDDMVWELPATARVYCTQLDGQLEGSLTSYDVTKRSDGPPGAGPATDSHTLTLAGRFSYEERLAAGEPSRLFANATGSFDATFVDFQASGASFDPSFWIPTAALVLALLFAAIRLALPMVAPLYTRLARSDLLDHPRRALVMEVIEANPGSSITDVEQISGLARGVVKHHVQHMVIHALVERLRFGRDVLLFAATMDREGRARALLARSPELAWTRNVCRNRPVRSAAVRAIRKRFEISDTAARGWLERATTLGIIAAEHKDSEVRLRCLV